MAWTKEELKENLEEIQQIIAFRIKSITNSLDRRKDGEVFFSVIEKIKEKGFNRLLFSKLVGVIEFIRKNILQKEERDIFNWKAIHDKTLSLDKEMENFEKKKLKRRLSLGDKANMESASRARQELKQIKKTENIEAIELKELNNLVKLHEELEELLDEIIEELEILEQIRKELAKKYREKDKYPKELKNLNNQSNESIQILVQLGKKLRKLLEEDDNLCIKLRKNDYIVLKITQFLQREEDKEGSLFKYNPDWDITNIA